MAQQVDIIPLQGGVDSVTSPTLVKPGKLLSAWNFEPDIHGGYRRIYGNERYDGRPSPSDADYYVFTVTTTGSFAAGNTITGATSSETAVVLKVNSSTELIVTKVSGTFTASEVLNVGGSPQGTFVESQLNGGLTSVLHAEYKNLTADEYRSDIQKPPGSGPVRGVWHYNGEKYCFRDNDAATECIMYRATSSGWAAFTFGQEIQFDNAVGEISEGDTVTGGTSGASGIVKRALLRTGTWSSAGAGTLVFDSVAGTFQDNESLQVSAVTKADADGTNTDITLLPGGRFEFDNYNFTGSSDTFRMYCADGVNHLGEFDGTRWVPIRTGIGADKPEFVKGHKNHLFIISSSSVQFSSIGDPYAWTALTGASQMALGEPGTALLPQVGDANNGVMMIATATKTYILYGNSSSDFNLVLHAPETGAKKYTSQNIGFAYFWDNKGLTQLKAAQEFGGFQMSAVTKSMQNFVDLQQGKEAASCIVRNRNQYRIFFDDGTCLIVYIRPDGKVELMPLNYGTSKYFNQVCSFVDTDGKERILAAGSDGYVYELDKGTSFDGDEINYHFMMMFTSSNSLRLRKQYRHTVLQLRSKTSATINVGYDLSYGSGESSISPSQNFKLGSAGGFWDSFDNETIYWDGAYMQEIEAYTVGTGDNIAIIVSGESDEDEPFTVHTCILHYLKGRYNR